MVNLKERKQQLFSIIDNYDAFLGRQEGEDYEKRAQDLAAQKESINRDRYEIALIGFQKRGKSTLLNSLLGTQDNHDLSPVRVIPCTGAIVRYIDSALHPDGKGKEGAIIHFNDGSGPKHVTMAKISPYVDQADPGFQVDLAKRIDCIEVYGDFPLIETRGIIVDSPGLGSLHDQDYLAKSILSKVDVILCPVSASNPLDRTEADFLATTLPERDREKLMFVLTQIDYITNIEERPQTVAWVQETLKSILKLGKKPRLYQVAAKKVLEAYEAGKSPEEIEKIKKECGMRELEDAIDKGLRGSSIAETNLRSTCIALETWFLDDKNSLTEIRKNFNLQASELEAKGKALEILFSKTTNDYTQGIEELKGQWKTAVRHFTGKVYDKRRAISERLVSELEKGKLKDLIGYPAKLERSIQAILESQLKDELTDFEQELESIEQKIAGDLNSKINESVELYYETYPETNSKTGMGSLIGGGIAVGGTTIGGAAVVSSLAAIASAATGVTVATGELATVMAGAGVFTKIGAFFGAGPIVAAQTGVAAAEAALSAALIGAIFPVLAGSVVIAGACKLGLGIIKNQDKKIIPDMVEKKLDEVVGSIEMGSQEMLDKVLLLFQANLKTLHDRMRKNIDTVKEQDNDLKRKVKIQEIEQGIKDLEGLSKELVRYRNSLEVV